MAELFPLSEVFIGSQQQGTILPSLGINFYEIKNSQRLIDTTEYTFGIEITYVPKNSISTYELNSAIYAIQHDLNVLQSDIGTFSCYDKDSDITDGLAHVTGIVTVSDITVKTDPIIQTADQIII